MSQLNNHQGHDNSDPIVLAVDEENHDYTRGKQQVQESRNNSALKFAWEKAFFSSKKETIASWTMVLG